MADETMTIDDVVTLLETNHETVQRWLERGLVATQAADGSVQIRRADLDAFLQSENQGLARDASEA